MMLVTVTAFLLAVRLDAQVVAVLGLAGGFLTPPMLSTGVDKAVALFSYIALLNIGLLSVVFRKRWTYLALLGGLGTILMQIGWVIKFFEAEKIWVALGIFFGFTVLPFCMRSLRSSCNGFGPPRSRFGGSTFIQHWRCF